MSIPLLKVEALYTGYGEMPVLHNIALEIFEAEIVALVDVNLALSGADRGYVLETGSIVRSGLAADLISDPEVRRAYLGI